ncbi:hypothetical protein [Micromonospora polyrhachis]|uniref:Uncharacterized protein n=1 Tax=Micromonospora polyrhachis TaxID=1282883 RepID=A0A7W7SLQ2_9ACTN|nr:hypothetical protein [Micromonospora polyrhachis]MBB4957103.1 hypothetical protein [Micromonospora polyrhachis]
MQKAPLVFVVAPALMIVYGLVRLLDGLDGQYGPGFLWTLGHLAFLVALFLFGFVVLAARRMVGGGVLATTAAVAGIAGLVCSIAQIGIDIVVGLAADDKAAMRQMFGEVRDVPGVSVAVYGPGPALFYVGLLALVVHLAVVRVVPVWAPVAVLLAIGVAVTSLDLLPVAGLLILVALVALARRASADA